MTQDAGRKTQDANPETLPMASASNKAIGAIAENYAQALFDVARKHGTVDAVVADIREIAKMRYIWKNPLQLTDERLTALLGPGFNTPFDQAIATTVKPFFDKAGLESQSSANALGRLA